MRLIFESELLVVLVTLSGAISGKDCAEIEQYLKKGFTIKGVGDGPAGLKVMLEKIR